MLNCVVFPQGHLILMPHFGKRLVHVSKDEMVALLRERAVMFEAFSDKVAKDLDALCRLYFFSTQSCREFDLLSC